MQSADVYSRQSTEINSKMTNSETIFSMKNTIVNTENAILPMQGYRRIHTNLTLPLLSGYFHPMHEDAKIFENHLNPVMLVFIGKVSLSILR